jgi:hypothetical protein
MVALIGYVVHVALRAINLLGGHGYISPWIVAWSIPCVLIVVAGAVLTLTHALAPERECCGCFASCLEGFQEGFVMILYYQGV